MPKNRMEKFLFLIFDALFVIYGAKFVWKSILFRFIVIRKCTNTYTLPNGFMLMSTHAQINSLAKISICIEEMETKRNQHDT